ncbi:MAG: InlB B-repeat-containing protein [Lachnospiraceae bacterium]
MKKFLSKVMVVIMLISVLAPVTTVKAETYYAGGDALYEQTVEKATLAELKEQLAAAKENTLKKKEAYQKAYKKAVFAAQCEKAGSYGFFKFYGYSNACEVLEDKASWVTDYTKIGQPGDATSWDNFVATVPFLKECNRLRAQEGVDPQSGAKLYDLQVSMTLMAVSEVQGNWASYNLSHPGRYNVGENLAWGYSNPFSGWYRSERNLWVSGVREFQRVGHYLNVCNGDYSITGFAVNQYSSYGVTHEQSFYFSPYSSKDTMTISQFEGKLNQYPVDIKNIKNACVKAKAAYEKAIAYQNQIADQINNYPVTYKLTYVLNGGTNNDANPSTYKNTSETFTLKPATKRGYKFLGWYTDDTYKTKITKIVKGTRGNKVLYAAWKKNVYSINYVLNNGINSAENPASYTVTSPTIVFKNPTRKGFAFKGWYTDADFTNKVAGIRSGSIGNRTYYAKWVKQKYTITYNLDGGVNNILNPASYNVTTDTIVLKNPTKAGYTFAGWYKDSDFQVRVTEIKKGSTGNKVLYAKWIEK